MPSLDRRAAARRRAWGRGPVILRFEPLEGRQLMDAAAQAGGKPDLVISAFDTLHNLDWGQHFDAVGSVRNEGSAPAPAGVALDVYATATMPIGADSVYVGTVTLDAPLEPGASASFREPMTTPPRPLTALGGQVSYYLAAKVDPNNQVAESNEANNSGNGFDLSMVTITPRSYASLSGSEFALDLSQASWGDEVVVTARVTNNAQANAPATRARIVLVPQGTQPGGPDDLTLGSLDIPAVPAWQTVGTSTTLTLPLHPPKDLAGTSSFTVAMIPDADFLTRPALSRAPVQGAGLDSAPLRITPPAGSAPSEGPQPDLTLAGVQVPAEALVWGKTFEVSTTLENRGDGDSGPLRVRFLLIDANRLDAYPLAIADAVLPDGLKAGHSQGLVQTIDLQGRLPSGLTPDRIDGRIVVLVDPEHATGEADETNNGQVSGAVKLRLLDREGNLTEVPSPVATVTTTPPPAMTATTTTTTTTTTPISPTTTAAPATSSPTPSATSQPGSTGTAATSSPSSPAPTAPLPTPPGRPVVTIRTGRTPFVRPLRTPRALPVLTRPAARAVMPRPLFARRQPFIVPRLNPNSAYLRIFPNGLIRPGSGGTKPPGA